MAAPFFDPMQWLRTPSPVATPAFNPQSDILDQLRQQQEEEEEKRLNAEKMLADLIERSRNKKEEERIERLRSEMPQDIYERLHKGYYGDPQSKAGKVGSAILQIGSGMFGTAPDINKASMEQWKAQQTAANAADTIQQREQAAAASAISRMQQSQSRMAETEAKNRTTIAGKLIESQVREAKNAIDRMKVMGQQTGIDAKAALDSANAELIKNWGAIKTMGGIKDDGLLLTVYEKAFGKEAADQLARNMTATTVMNKYQPATPGSTSVTQSPLVNPQTGEFIGMKPPSTSVRSGKPQIGDPNVLLRMRGLTTNDAVNPQAPQMPTMPQPAVVQPVSPSQLQGGAAVAQNRPPIAAPAAPSVAQQKPTVPNKDGVIDWDKTVGKSTYPIKGFVNNGYVGESNIQIAAAPYGTFIGGARQPAKTAKEQAEEEMGNKFAGGAINTLVLLEDAFKSGKAQENWDKWRTGLSALPGVPTLYNILTRHGWRGEDAEKLEVAFDQTRMREMADYLKQISGAQVSDAEYERLQKVFANGTVTPEEMVRLSLYNALYVPAVDNMFKMGLMNRETTNLFSAALSRVAKSTFDKYMAELSNIYEQRNFTDKTKTQARKDAEERLNKLKNPNYLIEEALRQVYAGKEGSTIVIQRPEQRRDIHVYIPFRNKDMDEVNGRLQDARAQESWNKKFGVQR